MGQISTPNAAPTEIGGATPARLISIGDSLSLASAALGASTIANMYMRKVAAYLGLGTTDGNGPGAPNAGNFVESAISGINSQRYLNALNRNLSIAPTDLICGVPLFNTMRGLGPEPRFVHELLMQLEGTLAWLCIPESMKTRAILRSTTTVNPAVTTVGGVWAYFAATVGTDLNELDLRSTNGTSATFPAVQGDTVYVWYFRSTLAESFAITVDGVSYNVGGAASYNVWLNAGIDWELCLLRVTGLAPGAHTVAAVRGAGAVNIAAVAGFTSATVRASCAAVLVTNCPVMITNVAAQGYAFAGNTANDPLSNAASPVSLFGHAGVDTYNRLLDAAIKNLQKDGLRIAMLDINSLTMPTNHVSGDFVHYNDTWNELAFRNLRRQLFRNRLGTA